jgi:hypothetical protein
MSKARDIADLGAVTSRLDTVGASDGALSNRNMIVNGAMKVHQRGDLTGVTSTTNYFVDRFQLVATDEGTWSLTQEDDAPSGSGFTKSAKLEITTADSNIDAGDYAQLRYKFESQDVKHLLKGTSEAKKCTLSFWVKSSIAQNYTVRMRETNSATSRQNVKQYTVSSANTWQEVVMTFDGDTGGDDFSTAVDINGNLVMEWMLGGGTDYQGGVPDVGWEDVDTTAYDATDTFLTTVNSTFQITGVQLEVGDTATPFEHRSYSDELQRCKRYYEVFHAGSQTGYLAIGTWWATNEARCLLQYTEKRTDPSISASDVICYLNNSATEYYLNETIDDAHSTHALLYGVVPGASTTRGHSLQMRVGASGSIQIDAEL